MDTGGIAQQQGTEAAGVGLAVAEPSLLFYSVSPGPTNPPATGQLSAGSADAEPVIFADADDGRPLSGYVLVAPDGTFEYAPRPGFIGTDGFTYTVTDANGEVTSLAVSVIAAYDSPQTISGTAGDDLLFGGTSSNAIVAGSGDDHLDGGRGADRLDGGLGDDSYVVDASGDRVVEAAGGGFDTVTTYGDYTIDANVELLIVREGGTGRGDGRANVITSPERGTILYGGGGDDTLTAYESPVYGGDGDDLVTLRIGRAYGGAGNDHLIGERSTYLDGGPGADLMEGEAGGYPSTYVVDNVGDVVLDHAGSGLADFRPDIVLASISYTLTANVENLSLQGDAPLSGTGNDLANEIIGNLRTNTLTGGAGNDTLRASADTSSAGTGQGRDLLYGGEGYDTLYGDGGGDTLRGGDDNDRLVGRVGDSLYGDSGDDRLSGGTFLRGDGGNDQLTGGDGSQTFIGGTGADLVDAGLGVDTADYSASNAGVSIDRESGLATGGHAEGDSLRSIEILVGSRHDDSLAGNTAKNTLYGGSGNDTLSGRDADDVLFGGDGADVLTGGRDRDTLTGGKGDDRLTGNDDPDVFRFDAGRDTVTDFRDDADTILFDDALWGGGGRTADRILDHGRISGGKAVFDFGNGQVLTVAGVTSLNSLADDVGWY